MFKKINLIIVSFFSILSINYSIGYSFVIPIFFFYLLKDYKNIYYILPSSLISIIIFSKTNLVSYLVLALILLIFVIGISILAEKPIQKISNNLLRIIIFIYLLISNIITLIFFTKTDILFSIIYSSISLIIYIFLEFNLISLIKNQTKGKNTDIIIFLELIVYLITSLGSSTIVLEELNIGIFVTMFFTMLLSKKYKNVYSFIYSIIACVMFILLKGETISFFLPVIGAFYLLPKLYAFFVLNCFLTLIMLFNKNQTINPYYYIYIMFLSVIFELLGQSVFYEKKTDQEEYEYIYKEIMNNVSKEILNFSVFLDKFIEIFKKPNDYNETISDEIKIRIQNICNNCYKKKDCFNKYQEKLYEIFKEGMTTRIKNQEFLRYCPNHRQLDKPSAIYQNNEQNTNNGLVAQIYTISNAIKKYILELTSKEEIKQTKITEIKRNLIDYGIDIYSFKINKNFKDDFNITISLNDNKYTEKEIIKIIKTFSENILKEKVTVLKKEINNEEVYIILPEIKIDIIYGYGSLSEEKISGDNYLIKEMSDGKLLAAICDGMGKGYSAFKTSNATIELINRITDLDIDINSSLTILNNLYTVQDYLERYSTLDLMEINRFKKKLSIYKMGGSTSYIIHKDGKMEKVINSNLPFGIDEELNKKEIYLNDGDLILMSSDGIFENFVNEKEIEDYILSIKDLSPQKLVYEIIRYTMKKEIKVKDDMSIIALRISEI